MQAVHFEPYIQITRQQPKHEKHERSDSMSPIHFSLPTQVFLETDAVAHHAALFARGKKAMIVTGRTSAKRNGAQDDVVAALAQHQIPYVLYDAVPSNPDIETCYEGARIAKEAGADFVKTSTGFGTGGATAADIALMRRTVGSAMGVKAAGGIRTLDAAFDMIRAGATRIGTSAGVAIVEALAERRRNS